MAQSVYGHCRHATLLYFGENASHANQNYFTPLTVTLTPKHVVSAFNQQAFVVVLLSHLIGCGWLSVAYLSSWLGEDGNGTHAQNWINTDSRNLDMFFSYDDAGGQGTHNNTDPYFLSKRK